MIEFRDRMAAESGMELIEHINQEGVEAGINPFDHGSSGYTDVMKTQSLKQALDKYGFDAAFGGARRDEEATRAKERYSPSATSITAGTPRTSVPSCGISTTPGSTRASPSALFRSPTGPSWISGNTSTWNPSPSSRSTMLPRARWWSAMACW